MNEDIAYDSRFVALNFCDNEYGGDWHSDINRLSIEEDRSLSLFYKSGRGRENDNRLSQ